MQNPESHPIYVPVSKCKRIAIFFFGTFINSIVFNYGWDYVLYPYVIWKLGTTVGGAIMLVTSTIVCIALLKFYDWSKQDWLGIETLKELRDVESHGKIRRWISRILKKGDAFALVILSIQFDPFITTVYMRHGSHLYNGMGKRDWNVFLASTVIANLYWIFVATLAVQFFSWLYHLIITVL